MNADFSCSCRTSIPAHGESTCHCSACHASFAGLTAFDRHRASGECAAPQTGVVDARGRGWPIDHEDIWHWGEVRTIDQWRAIADARRLARRAVARTNFRR